MSREDRFGLMRGPHLFFFECGGDINSAVAKGSQADAAVMQRFFSPVATSQTIMLKTPLKMCFATHLKTHYEKTLS